jgi:hypothetical protein
MLKNIFKRREESDAYLTQVWRNHWSRKSSMKIDEMELSANTVAFISFRTGSVD